MLSCILTSLQTELILNFNWCKQTTEGEYPMKTIYVIIHHYFDEAKQQKANNIHSTYNSYHEALEKVKMFEHLGGYDGWFEIKRTGSNYS